MNMIRGFGGSFIIMSKKPEVERIFFRITSIGIDEKACVKSQQYITIVMNPRKSMFIHVCGG
jgi:hypothetical protein